VKDARNALESVKSKLDQVSVAGETYWMGDRAGSLTDNKPAVYLLPAYDEFLISYYDRSAALSEIHNKKAISDNGLFRPVIVSNGQVIGIWKRFTNKEIIILECQLFKGTGKALKKSIELAAEIFGQFLNKKVRVIYV
jgi:hypothetical protein